MISRGRKYSLRVALVLAMVALPIAGCESDAGADGKGNDYSITAIVIGETGESVLVDQVVQTGSVQVDKLPQALYAHGKAAKWFTTTGGVLGANHRELQNNYTDPDGHKREIGHIFSGTTEIEPKALTPGQIVYARGRIRSTRTADVITSNADGTTTVNQTNENRAVFEHMEIIAP
jgi:hypothetical protein